MTESIQPEDSWIVGAPPGNHPILSELARFHAGFATLEASLTVLMAFALGKPMRVGEAILERIRNIADRIEIIGAVAAAADHLTEKQKTKVRVACEMAADLNARRNVYSHSLYEHSGEEIRVRTWAFSARKSRSETLTLEKVQEDITQVDNVLMAALSFCDHLPGEVVAWLEASPERPEKPNRPTEPHT